MTKNPTTTTRKRDADVREGDVLEFLGRWHRIVTIEPASEATQAMIPGARRAVAADCWSVTLDPSQPVHIWTVA